MFIRPLRDGGVKDPDLPVGAGSSFKNRAGIIHLVRTIKEFNVFGHQLDQFFQQMRIEDDLAFAKIHQPFIDPVTVGPPAVFFDKKL